ncbi:MAG TPA: aminotransferase class V-fold PLP-dependent enzyme, partial [Myxococcota bacterium]
MIYLDANASVPPLACARQALVDAAALVGNPSSPHALGRAARAVLDTARDHVARALGGDPRELVLTSGASEGNRWLVDAVARWAAPFGRDIVVAASALEHPSLEKPLAALVSEGRVVRADILDDAELARADVVFCTAAHNESGILPDLARVVALAKPECIVCADAAQAVARLPVLPARVDAVVASAHKIGAFAGAGALLVRGNAKAKLKPPWRGGGQEASMRPGTEALALHAAFGAAASVVDDTRAAHQALAPLRDRIEKALV